MPARVAAGASTAAATFLTCDSFTKMWSSLPFEGCVFSPERQFVTRGAPAESLHSASKRSISVSSVSSVSMYR